MADILALVLKHNSAQTQGLKNFSFTSGTGWNTSPCMIVGERCGIKTSLLFLAAVTAASELGVKVLFLTPTPIQKLPAPLQDSLANLNPDGLKKIKFMYPRSQEELLQDVASLHESACGSAAPPSLLIVDGLERYLGRGRGRARGGAWRQPAGDGWLAVAHISALLVDTAAFLGRKLEERGGAGASCRVLVSFDTERQGHAPGELPAQDPVLSVLDRYFPVRATLDRDRSAAAPGTAGEPGAVWQVYFSGVGVTAGHAPGKGEGPNPGLQWRLAICQNGAMEFSLVSGENQAKQ
ncbi:hypothetical protein ANANG_G00295580 [Anguilla anguilla]|uniref:SWIM-type zinc finger 7 associated protein 1 n=1 Tax=Anguilla anguilla TaxID=7936 RepID=A0A9D3LM63_ANGAN|nr:hypothetical protein ANANG_G00295580 [Anguilla anguilla]